MTLHGMTGSEVSKLALIREMALTDMATAKREASDWIMANKSRSVLRRMACNTIKGINAAPQVVR